MDDYFYPHVAEKKLRQKVYRMCTNFRMNERAGAGIVGGLTHDTGLSGHRTFLHRPDSGTHQPSLAGVSASL